MLNADLYKRFLRHYAGNIWRFATIPWQQRTITIQEATTIFGCSFDNSGWHHIVQTLKEYDSNPNISYKNTSLYIFLKYFCPENICSLNIAVKKDIPLFCYPWGMMFRSNDYVNKDVWHSRFCGPSTDQFIEEEFKRIIALYNIIKKIGYKPWSLNYGFICGTFLLTRQGKRRFVVLQGNHRMAILAHLGVKKLSVRTISGYLPWIREEEILEWYFVKNNLFIPNLALQVFNLYFKENGTHIKKLLDCKLGIINNK